MTNTTRPELESTTCSPDPMFDVLEATTDDVVAVRVPNVISEGSEKLYDLLAVKNKEHGIVNVYEDAPNCTLSTYLANWCGIGPDLRRERSFEIGRYARRRIGL